LVETRHVASLHNYGCPRSTSCPAGYRPLDAFWSKRGYQKVDGLIGSYRWKEVDTTEETDKPMQFWMKAL